MVIDDVSAAPGPTDTSDVAPVHGREGVVVDGHETEPAERTSARVGPPKPGLLVIALAAGLFVSIVAAFLGLFAYGLSGLQEHRSQQQLYAEFRELLPGIPVAPRIGGHIPAGTPVALINAPAAGIHNVMVVEGTSSEDLLAGPGHVPDTPLPGQGGEAVLAGKSTTAGAPFAGLARLRTGDVVTVRTGQGLFHFTVEGRIRPGAHPLAIRANESRLVLVTSAGTNGLQPTTTLYVEATLRGKAVAAPPHRPTTAPLSNIPGETDPAAWPFVALWLAGLAAASAAIWWLWTRWGILRAWIVGAPVLLALLWGLSNEAMRLLPNVY